MIRKTVWAGLGLLILGTASARADLVPLYSGNGGTAGNFNYNLVFSTNPTTPPVQVLNPYPSTDVLGHQMGAFVTIYDFNFGTNNPLTSVTAPTGWIYTVQPTGLNGYNTNPPDAGSANPNITNVSFYYTGTATVATDTVFSGFQLRSSLTEINPFGNFSSNDAKYDAGAGLYTANGTTGSVTIAGPASPPAAISVPEPSSLVALGTGALAALGLLRRRRAAAL